MNDYITIEKKSSTIAKNRVMDYQKSIFKFARYDKTKQLIMVNSYLNQLLSQYDDVIQKKRIIGLHQKSFL